MTQERDTRGALDEHAPAHGAGPEDFDASNERYASFVPAARTGRPGHAGSRKPHSNKKAALIFGGAVAALLVIVYVAGALAFSDRFMPNTSIMGKDVSLKSSAEVQDMLVDVAKNYTLDVSGQDFSLKLTSSDMGTGVNAQSVTDAMHADANPWAWPAEIFRVRDESDKLATSNSKLDDAARTAVEAFNADATPPRNAGLDYDDAADQFVVRTETAGQTLDADKVVEIVNAAVADMKTSATLGDEVLEAPTLLSDDPRLAQAADDANALLKADFTLTLADTTVAEVNADQVADWMRLKDDVSVGIDEDALADWVQGIASDCNTYQAHRTYTRADGKEVSVSGGVYGWIVDKDALKQEVLNDVQAARTGEVPIPCEQEAGAFDGLHGRDWGPRYIDIDLTEQHARFYDDAGALTWESDVVTGTPDGEHDTPEGVYALTGKESPSKLIGQMKPETGEPEYQTEVEAWMPFVENYIGLHDAEWQPEFGGSRYSSGYGSHGCVNLPTGKAKDLYDLVEAGDVVVSHW